MVKGEYIDYKHELYREDVRWTGWLTVISLMALLDTNGKVSSFHTALQSYANKKKWKTKLLNSNTVTYQNQI